MRKGRFRSRRDEFEDPYVAWDATLKNSTLQSSSRFINLLCCGYWVCLSDGVRYSVSLCMYTYSHRLSFFVTFPWEIRVLLLYWLLFKSVYVYTQRAASQNFPLGHVATCRVLRTESSFNPLVLCIEAKIKIKSRGWSSWMFWEKLLNVF